MYALSAALGVTTLAGLDSRVHAQVAEPVLRWGGDVVQSDTGTDRAVSDQSDKDAATSRRATFFLDHTATFSPKAMAGPQFYGGVQVVKQGSTQPAGLARLLIKDADAVDVMELYFQRPPDSTGGHGSAAIVWPADQFAGGGRAMSELVSLQLTLGPGNSFDEVRWLVKTGGAYLLSKTSFVGGAGDYQLADPAAAEWLVYRPTRDDLAFDADAATPTPIAPDASVEAVGFYVDKDLSDSRNGSIVVQSFTVYAKGSP